MKYLAKFLLKIMGWKTLTPPVPEPKCIILGVPHTSVWDFVISFLYYKSFGSTAYIMIKKEFFRGPLGPILKSMGGIPVDRKHPSTITRQVIDAFNNTEHLHLAIAPEGTRDRVEKWKTGFYTIAKAANVPVYLGFFDWGKKEVSRGIKFELSDDVNEDLKKIRQYYKDLGVKGKHPENFTTGSDLD
jgi:1-acyl-sn-glycerol-3-phosphate acyltransferase